MVLLTVGRLRDARLVALYADYVTRCRKWLRITNVAVRDATALVSQLPETGIVVLLDQRGEQLDSRQFAAMLKTWMETSAHAVTFVIGGSDGVTDAVRARAHKTLALGKMTFAHQLVHVLLAEQLYRAVSIIEGHPYHR